MGHVGMPLARPRKTIEDLLALPPDSRAELIAGEIYVTPTPYACHQRAVLALARALADHVSRGAGGEAFIAPFDVHLPTGDVVEPDALWVSPAHLGIVKETVHGAPDLVVEVLSPGDPERDRIVKRDLYERSGVPEFWVADPATRSVEVFRLEEGRYRPAGWFTPGTRLVSPSFPGWCVAVDDLFPAPPVPPAGG